MYKISKRNRIKINFTKPIDLYFIKIIEIIVFFLLKNRVYYQVKCYN